VGKKTSHIPITQKSLFFWAFKGNLKLQLLLLLLIVGIVFARVIPLEMQKRIINEAIVLRKFDSLLLYCGIYLLAVTATACIKFAINYIQAILGERVMLSMRKALYHHILTLPLYFFRNTQPGMVVASLMTELASAGTFAGMALAVPVSNILTLLAFAGYLIWLNSKLAMATLCIYPVVVFLIPYLQKKVNLSNKKRVDQSRIVSSQIAESITGINEINVHGAYFEENRKFDGLVERLRVIRTKWSLLRYSIKTVNNYFVGLGPFVVFLFGGFLVINGELELGSMVAFLSAQEKLYDPWKELIEFYQVYQDASVRYKRTMQYFDTPVELDLAFATTLDEKPKGQLEVSNLGYSTKDGIILLKGVTFSLKAGEHLALVGFSGSGKSTLVQCVAKMFNYTSGSILLDGREVKDTPKNETIEHVGYISQNPFIFSGTIRDNLLYAHRAAHEIGCQPQEQYQPPNLDHLILALQQAGLFVDVIRFGLDCLLEQSDSEMISKVVRIRKQFRKNFGESLTEYVEFYQEDEYLYHASVAENLVFGTSTRNDFSLSSLAVNRVFRSFIDEIGLTDSLLTLGADLARQSVEFFSGLDGIDLFFEASPVSIDQLDACRALLKNLGSDSPNCLGPADQTSLLTFALQFTPGRHKLLAIETKLENKILQGRRSWKEWSTKKFPNTTTSFEKTNYIEGQSILNNILFGRLKTELSHAQEKINQDILRLLIEEDCLEAIADAGMGFLVGSMGDRLSGGQRQKLAIARVLLKDPKIILMDESTSALDNKSQTRIQRLIEQRWKNYRTVIAVVHRLDIIKGFDKIGVLKAGMLREFGTYNELIEKKGLLYELVFGKD